MKMFVVSLVIFLLTNAEAKVFTFSFSGTGNGTVEEPRDCHDILTADSSSKDGVYSITPRVGSGPIDVFCDMTNDGGGWTVIQQRTDGSVNFYRNWADYKWGFGALVNEYWLGNNNIYRITNQRVYSIRIDIEDFKRGKRYAVYDKFFIDNEKEKYRLHVSGYNGTAGDAFSDHNMAAFSTYDRDNDRNGGASCAKSYLGGWWYVNCHNVNLNGQYNNHAYGKGIIWYPFTSMYQPLKGASMKIRP